MYCTKIKVIKRESKNIMWIWERKLLEKGCTNIISLLIIRECLTNECHKDIG